MRRRNLGGTLYSCESHNSSSVHVKKAGYQGKHSGNDLEYHFNLINQSMNPIYKIMCIHNLVHHRYTYTLTHTHTDMSPFQIFLGVTFWNSWKSLFAFLDTTASHFLFPFSSLKNFFS